MKIQFLETNPSEKRIIEHLKNVKEESGEEIKAQILRAITAFYDVYAIGNNPDSTKADLEMAMLRCWNLLSTHLGEVALYGKNHKYNVSLSYPHFALIDSMALSHFPAVTREPTIAESAPNVSQQEPDRNHTVTTVEEKKEVEEIDEDDDDDDDNDEDDDDPYAGMSDEEYLAATAHLSYIPEAKY